MKCEKTQNVWKITDQFGDFIHLTEKELLELYDEIAKQTHQWAGMKNKDE